MHTLLPNQKIEALSRVSIRSVIKMDHCHLAPDAVVFTNALGRFTDVCMPGTAQGARRFYLMRREHAEAGRHDDTSDISA
jgi:hypothetical protein